MTLDCQVSETVLLDKGLRYLPQSSKDIEYSSSGILSGISSYINKLLHSIRCYIFLP